MFVSRELLHLQVTWRVVCRPSFSFSVRLFVSRDRSPFFFSLSACGWRLNILYPASCMEEGTLTWVDLVGNFTSMRREVVVSLGH
jgi:hypothetical protein